MKRTETTLTGHDGLTLRRLVWLPDDGPRGLVVISHGLGEHIGRYEHVAAALVEDGWGVTGADHRGHGRSEGLRGHVDGMSRMGDDLLRVLTTFRAEHPDQPVALWAHSMGGLVALQMNLDHPDHGLTGLVLSNPLLATAFTPPRAKVAVGRLIARVLPRLRLANELDPNLVSRDPEEVRKYTTDPLVHSLISTRAFTSLEAAEAAVLAAPQAIVTPTLWLLGGSDGIVSAPTSQAFAARLPPEITTVRAWPDGYHEPHNDLHRDEVISTARQWLGERR